MSMVYTTTVSVSSPPVESTNLFSTVSAAHNHTNHSSHMHDNCLFYKENLTFNGVQLARVLISWLFFLISSFGNLFVLWCLRGIRRKTHVHVITLHLTLADLVYTFLVIPLDATWNVTMGWYGGIILCKICQMGKQFGMYISSLMVMVIALDRVFSILMPMMSSTSQRRVTNILLVSAWLLSALCAMPPGFLFTVIKVPYCVGEPPFPQCVDNPRLLENGLEKLHMIYYVFTMCMSFIVPFAFVVISYSLVLCEITNMVKRHQVMMGRREGSSFSDIQKARRKTLILTSAVTLTFLLFWGPYYSMAIYDWIDPTKARHLPHTVTICLFVLMYVHPAVHPFIYGLFMKAVRKQFRKVALSAKNCLLCRKNSKTSILKGQRSKSAPIVLYPRKKRTDERSLRLLQSEPVPARTSEEKEFSPGHSTITNLSHPDDTKQKLIDDTAI
ncbi:gonadotropin-releasing hormone receptor-like isoform X1 [Clavelina lepadiformis]|uniref:gonadotropin-releasing hormone receptor-like isoform X1 n=1 Tax=Clavelina lepadiformis TaxID=159417 RepID=UPI0040428B05